MTFFGASDIAGMLADFGVPIVSGVTTGKGIVDQVDREAYQDQSVQFTGREVTVTVETAKFAALKSGSAITVEGVEHLVRHTRRIGDGALTEVMCVPTAVEP
jgi:hypothetical protein